MSRSKQFVAVIRGINVGGYHRVNMEKLRAALEKEKFQDVRTYIQSGNLIFQTMRKSTDVIERIIRKVMRSHFMLDVPVLVREGEEWQRTITRNPFVSHTDDPTKLLVTFLSCRPAAQAARALRQKPLTHDEVIVDGKDAYLFCRNGYGQTELTNTFIEKQLMVTATTRNWRTVLQIADMLE